MTVNAAVVDIPEDAVTSDIQVIRIPYTPRAHFKALHSETARFIFLVAHRRAGKSVFAINHMIRAALMNQRQNPPPRYAYVGPSFDQTKDLIWGYLKQFAGVIPGVKFAEGDLMCTLPNGATIRLYGGAAAYERMRGMYFDGIMLDEFPLLNPAVFSTVVRPCLADYRGWAIVSGTSNGDDHFAALKKRAEKNNAKRAKEGKDPNWAVHSIPVTMTDALHPDEVIEMTEDMTPEEYAREMLCSFDAPIEGSYYGDIINGLSLRPGGSRFTGVPYDPAATVMTWWDLGIDDAMSVWFVQRVGRELHVINHMSWTGKGLPDIIREIKSHSTSHMYNFGAHVFPHDIKARELGTGRSRYEIVCELLENVFICPLHKVEDGIAAVKSVLPICWFDEKLTESGVMALRNYHKSKAGKPVHNWASHPSDAFRTGAVALNQIVGYLGASNVTSLRQGALRRKIRGIR